MSRKRHPITIAEGDASDTQEEAVTIGLPETAIVAQEATSTDASPVWKELPVPGSTDTIVLLDPDQGPMTGPFHNLLRCDADHHAIWTATLPELYAPGRPDCYVSVRWEDDTLDANTWSGHRVRLDPATGKIVATTFVK